jgi:hypothetical protein
MEAKSAVATSGVMGAPRALRSGKRISPVDVAAQSTSACVKTGSRSRCAGFEEGFLQPSQPVGEPHIQHHRGVGEPKELQVPRGVVEEDLRLVRHEEAQAVRDRRVVDDACVLAEGAQGPVEGQLRTDAVAVALDVGRDPDGAGLGQHIRDPGQLLRVEPQGSLLLTIW